MSYLTHCSVSGIARMCLAGLILASGGACADEPEQVLASIKPLALIAREITEGTSIKTGYLLPPSTSEHNYALRISDIKRLHRAKLVIWLDKDIEPYLESSRGSWLTADDTRKSLALLAAMAPTLYKNNNHDEDHQHGAVDPHVWLNPLLAQQLAKQVADRLAEIYPENKHVFASNWAKFSQKSQILNEITAKNLEPYSASPFFVEHDAYRYFVGHYGLNQVGAMRIRPETALSLSQLRTLQLTMESQTQTPCLFHEPQLSRTQVPVFGAGSVVSGELDPLGMNASSYNQLIESLTKAFVQCFEQTGNKK